MAKRTPIASFELYFPDVNPEAVTVRALSDTLSAIHRLAFPDDLEIDAGDIEEGAGEEERKRISVRVLKIKRGSAAYACIADRPEMLIENLRRASSAILGKSLGELQLPSVVPLRTLSQIARALKTAIAIRQVAGPEVIRFEPSTYEGISESLFVRGRKRLVGEVARVGGSTAPRCALRVEGRGRLLFCAVKGEGTIDRLARHLYKEAIMVTGEATWLRHNWRVVDFEIDAVEELPQEPLSAAFDALREAGGDAWDSIADPAEFLDEVSGV